MKPFGSGLISIVLFLAAVSALFCLTLYPVLRNTANRSSLIAMADQSPLNTSLARRELSDLERLAITGEASPDKKLERMSELPSERLADEAIRQMVHPDISYIRRVRSR